MNTLSNMRPKPKSLAELQRMADDFNERFPVGTAVTCYRLINPLAEPTETKTTTPAWVMGGHSVMVTVAGFSGGQCLEAIRVL